MLLILRDPALQVLELYVQTDHRTIATSVMDDLLDERTINELFIHRYIRMGDDSYTFVFEDAFIDLLKDIHDRA